MTPKKKRSSRPEPEPTDVGEVADERAPPDAGASFPIIGQEYGEIVATVREALVVLDAELRVRTANASFYRTFEVTPEETRGRLLYELGNGQWNIPSLRRRLEEVLRSDKKFEGLEIAHEFEHIGKRVMVLDARRMQQQGDHTPSILVSVEDVTGRKDTEAKAQLAAIVSSSEDAIISKDLNGVITSWNEGATRLFGYSAEEIIGKSVKLLIPEDHLDEEPRILEKIRCGEAIDHYETVRRRKDGSLVHISLSVSPVRDAAGRVLGASKIARDITERRRADEERRANHARLQAHTEELSRFNQAAVGRELRMIELKREVNALCQRLGEATRYPLEFDREE